jgi:hypothetical protein
MKLYLKLLPVIASPLLFCSCPSTETEYHTVRVIEYRKPAPKPKPPSDNPRDFVPREKF